MKNSLFHRFYSLLKNPHTIYVFFISFALGFARLICITTFFLALLAISIIGSVAQKSTGEGEIGIITKSDASIAGLASASILGGVSMMTISCCCFKILDS